MVLAVVVTAEDIVLDMVSVVDSCVESLCVDLACLPNRSDDVGQATIYTDANGPKQPGLITVRSMDQMNDWIFE
jgi:hypothetical protein